MRNPIFVRIASLPLFAFFLGFPGFVSASVQCPPGYHWDGCECIYTGSPIIVDTTGGGFQLTSAENGVLFDISGDGRPVQMGWTDATSGNAFLALDRNHNGTIDSGKELFGNFTPQPPSADPNGYLALAVFDQPENGGNGDGIIYERDAVFSHLLLWIDENHDGISQPNELHTLPERGVYSLALRYVDSPRTDQFGNQFRYKSAINPDPKDGESKDGRWSYDVFFTMLDANGASLPSDVNVAALTGGGQNTAPPCAPIGPYQVEPISIASQGPVAAGDCPTNAYPGYMKYVTNQVQHIDGSAYPYAGLTVADIISTGNPHDLGSGSSTGSAVTTGDGSFPDQYCVFFCLSWKHGETVATQAWTLSGVPLSHVDGVVYKCTGITIDGH